MFEPSDSDILSKFSKNVVTSSINLVSKKITVVLRENRNGDVFDVLSNIISKEMANFSIQILNQFGNPIFSLMFYEAKLVWHEQKFDYANADNSMHIIEVSYQRVERIPTAEPPK